MWKVFKSYFFWTYQRGSFHYDVMVTVILAFIFVSPHFINFRDKPVTRAEHPLHVSVETSGPDSLIFDVPATAVSTASEVNMKRQLRDALETVAGPIRIDRYEAVADASGATTGYKVWAHR